MLIRVVYLGKHRLKIGENEKGAEPCVYQHTRITVDFRESLAWKRVSSTTHDELAVQYANLHGFFHGRCERLTQVYTSLSIQQIEH